MRLQHLHTNVHDRMHVTSVHALRFSDSLKALMVLRPQGSVMTEVPVKMG